MLSVALAVPAWTAARMAASVGSGVGSAAAAGAAGRSCLVGACRRGLVERRSVGDVAPSRCGIATLVDDAEMSSLNECNDDARN